MSSSIAFAGPVARVEMTDDGSAIKFLSWDTEGGNRVERNLLREPARATGAKLSARADGGSVIISLDAPGRFVLPFDPRVTPTTILTRFNDDGSFELPGIVNAPDFGPMRLAKRGGGRVVGRLTGSRVEKWVKLLLACDGPVELEFTPLLIDPPAELKSKELWPLARRGWLNAIQPCAQWGEQGRPFSAPAGILGNNVISDPASTSLWFYADQISLTPPPIRDELTPMLRRTIEYWIDTKMRRDAAGKETGEITGYWDYHDFLDANASPVIAAWDYVEASGDKTWLAKKLPRLELAAEYLASRDIDGDGLIEATQSGNYNALQQPARSCAWWDALNCGHKDAYTNALSYRAFRCLADMEAQVGDATKQAHYAQLADRLKAAYAKTLTNPKTGWLAWWKSSDGTLHDYAAPTINALAIEYGLINANEGRRILDLLWSKMQTVGFKRFDLGIPGQLVPVLRADYLQPDAIGMPHKEDGTDTFGVYMNGGISAGHSLHFIDALYLVGETERADMVLKAMLERQQRGEFQNGVTDAAMQGIDWTTWDGKPSGYEGYLADSFRFVQAVLLREPQFRAKLYRPMLDH